MGIVNSHMVFIMFALSFRTPCDTFMQLSFHISLTSRGEHHEAALYADQPCL